MSNNRYANMINPNLPTDSPSSTVTNPMTTNLSMGGNKIVSVHPAVANDSVPTLGQVQSLINNNTFCPTATSDLNMNYYNVSNSRSLGLMATTPSNPPLVLTNQGTGENLLLGMSAPNGTGMSYIYDTVYNKPPSVASQTIAQICNASQDPTTHIVSAGNNVIGDILELDLHNWQNTNHVDIGVDTSGNLVMTKTGWADKFGIIYDTQYNKPPSSGGAGIAGLAVDPVSQLLCYQGQPLMVNQYIYPNIISLSAITSLYFNFSSISLPIATATVNGNFNDLFNPNLTYQLNFSFSSAEPVASFTNSLSTILTVIILDANGHNILAGAEPVVPVFQFDKRDGLFSYVNNNFVFQATLTSSSTPLNTDYYNMFTQGLNTGAVGPYTINLCISSMVSIQPTPTYFVATSLNTASFEVWDIDMSNPFPVVSNYDLTNGITTIRTSQHGLLIKSYRDRGTSLYTDSLQLIPTYSTTPKTWHGVITGTVAAPDPSVHFIINVNKVPTTPFAYTCILFVYISNTNCVTDNNTGIANPITYTVSAQSSNVVSWIGANIYPPVITMDPTGFLVNVQHEIPLGSPAFNYTLTYDFISL